WRVHWAFALKGIACEFHAINLLTDEVDSPEHRKRNPMGFVPALEFVEEGRCLGESIAIIEWAEETKPEPSLLPGDAFTRARIRQLSEIVNAGTQPLQNLNAMHLHSPDPAEQKRWNQHWIRAGLGAYEALVKETAGNFSVGERITMADLFLIPQAYNAGRNDVPLTDYPTIARITQAALSTPACQASHPDRFAPV
ncbi:MAG: maleylacetoacetate isomerase, partial [Bdellovibrionota bacterium]